MSWLSAAVLCGTVLTISAMASFATLDTTTKYISTSVPLFLMALCFRYAFQAVATTALMLPTRGPMLVIGLIVICGAAGAYLAVDESRAAAQISVRPVENLYRYF